jgi:glycosyltransferase involved in cell wall biosynthesis
MSSKGRILMLLGNNRFPQDPRVRNEATALADAGYSVVVVCRRGEGQARRERVSGVDVRRFRSPFQRGGGVGFVLEWMWSALACFAVSLRLSLRGGFDVVHAHNPPDTLVAVGAFHKLLRKRFVFDHHDLAAEMYLARSGEQGNALVVRVLRSLERLSCRLADHIIVTNESYRSWDAQIAGIPLSRITVVRNGPDPDRRAPVGADPVLRARAGTIIGYLGVMGRQDGVDHLLRAVWHLVHDLGRTDVLCIVIGRGDALPSLRRLAAELGIEDKVWFTGYVSEEQLIRYLCTADVCVDPDPSNPFNDRSTMLKMMDYMALGRPVVAFDLPEHRVTARSAALYVAPNDDLALARAVDELMENPERRRTMGEAGRTRVEQELAWRHSVPHLLRVYESFFDGAPEATRPAQQGQILVASADRGFSGEEAS